MARRPRALANDPNYEPDLPPERGFLYDPQTPLLTIGSRRAFTLDMAYEGVHIFGGTGSGKSSGSMATLARAYLSAGMGGLVLCAKPNEWKSWVRYAQQTGRESSLAIVDGSGQFRLNFLDYELHRPHGGDVHNLVELLLLLTEAVRSQERSGGGENPFWKDSARALLGHSFTILMAAYGSLRLAEVSSFIRSIPKRPEQTKGYFIEQSFAVETMKRAGNDPAHPVSCHDFVQAIDYFNNLPNNWDPKTTGNIDATITGMIDPFLKGNLHTLFCTNTNIVPELTHHGMVLIINLPIKHYKQLGRLAGLIWKYLFQQAAEARIDDEHQAVRPVFLAVDEAANFFTEYDNEFQSTARSARACSLYATQNIGSYYRPIGGHGADAQTEAFLGNFRSKIFHSNDDPRTNAYASQLVGRVRRWRRSYQEGETSSRGGSYTRSRSNTRSYGPGDMFFASQYGVSNSESTTASSQHGSSRSYGWSEQMDLEIEPNFFSRALRTGGVRYGRKVDALWFRSRADGGNWTLCTFRQQ